MREELGSGEREIGAIGAQGIEKWMPRGCRVFK